MRFGRGEVAWGRPGLGLVFVLVLGVFCFGGGVAWAGLPDGRVYEHVSPAHKGASVAGTNPGQEPTLGLALGGDDPAGVLFDATGPIGEALSGVDEVQYAQSTAGGPWETHAVLPRPLERLNVQSVPTDLLASTDLKSFAFTARKSYASRNPAGLGATSAGAYRVDSNRSLEWLSEPTLEAPEKPDPEPGNTLSPFELALAGASGDMGRVFFGYYGTLVPEDASREQVLAGAGGANDLVRDWGFYEWRGGVLRSAGALPVGSAEEFDRYGAAPAASLNLHTITPDTFHNQVSGDGSRAFFVSPDPELCPGGSCGREPELYVREEGKERGVLVSRDTLLPSLPGGEPQGAPHGPTIMNDPAECINLCESSVFASGDGSRAFFSSSDALVAGAPAGESLKEYEFNTVTNTLAYLPGVTPPVTAVSDDGSMFMFVDTAGSQLKLDLSVNGQVREMAPLTPSASSPCSAVLVSLPRLCVSPARFAAGGGVLVFGTDAVAGGGGFQQVYRYDVGLGGLSCVSCPSGGVVASGPARLANYSGIAHGTTTATRGVSSDGGRVFFDSPDALVPQDSNGRRDVYEWEGGRVFLISAGTGVRNSFYLDSSASGDNVFFATSDSLSSLDTDGGYDVYDARVGGVAPVPAVGGCVGDCQGPPTGPPVFGVPSSVAFTGEGNFPAPSEGVVESKSKAAPKKSKSKSRKRSRKKRARSRARGVGVRPGRGA